MQHKTKFFLVLLFFTSVLCVAQISEYDGPPQPSSAPTPPGGPIDGGLTLLLAAGAYYGIKKSIKK